MDSGLSLVLHPKHLNHGSSPAPLPLFPDAFTVATDSVVQRLAVLQQFAEDEAKHVQHLSDSSKFLRVDCGPSCLTIAQPFAPVSLSPFFAQMAQSTLSAPLDLPRAGGSIIGVIACCPPATSEVAFPALPAGAHGEADSAAWLLLVVSDFAAAHVAGSATASMRRVGDTLTAMGFIRNDFDECFDLKGQLGDGSFATVHKVGLAMSDALAEKETLVYNDLLAILGERPWPLKSQFAQFVTASGNPFDQKVAESDEKAAKDSQQGGEGDSSEMKIPPEAVVAAQPAKLPE